MCLATPGRIVSIASADPAFPVATVDFGAVTRSAQLIYVPEAKVGDYIIVQAGFAVRRVEETEALAAIRAASAMARVASPSARPSPEAPSETGARASAPVRQ